MTYVWPPLMKALNDRQKKIADGLAAAEKSQRDLELTDKKVATRLQEVRAQAQEVIDQANKRASQIIDEAKLKAQEECARLKTAADAEIDQEVNRARQTLKSQVATLALCGAEKILGHQLDKTANARLVDDLASQL